MAQTAIANLDNTIPINGGNEPIYVKYADEEGKNKRGGHGGMNNHGRGNNGGFHQGGGNNFNNNGGNNYMNQHHNQMGGYNSNSFQLGNNNQAAAAMAANSLQNLGKMKSNRTGGYQNSRFNPMSGTQNAMPLAAGNLTANSANNYNYMQQYSNFPGAASASNAAGGFDNLINTIGGNSAAANGNQLAAAYGHHGHMHGNAAAAAPGAQANNYMSTLNSAALVAAGLASADAGADLIKNSSLSGLANNGQLVYVYGIGQNATESELYSLFSTCGRILRVNVIKNQKTGSQYFFFYLFLMVI